MEEFSETENVPIGWTATDEVTEETGQGNVHSGNKAVGIPGDVTLTQCNIPVSPRCFYEFSFFARGGGGTTGVTANVIFQTPGGPVTGATIPVRQGDLPTANNIFSYYRTITDPAPADATEICIEFIVAGNQPLLLDDVSLST